VVESLCIRSYKFTARGILSYPPLASSNICTNIQTVPVFVYYGVLVHEGNVVMVEGGIMHEPKAGALSSLDCYYIARLH